MTYLRKQNAERIGEPEYATDAENRFKRNQAEIRKTDKTNVARRDQKSDLILFTTRRIKGWNQC